MKHEWRKVEKELYAPKGIEHTKVEEQTYITIKGEGNPNGEDFAKKVEALYTIAYAIRMSHKSDQIPEGYFEYTVYPLEGIWSTTNIEDVYDKSSYTYTIMIRQPKFVNEKVFLNALERARKKKPEVTLLSDVKLELIEDGNVVQMMHIGSYDDETASFEKMKAFIAENKLKRSRFDHREIYISDIRKTEASKLKTILRYFID